jgi:hypothetical protein
VPGGFGLGDDWQIRLRDTIRDGLCEFKEDTDCCKIPLAQRLSKVEPFLLYSLRHRFATRLATSPGMDAWTLCKIMGWSLLAVAMRYVHPDETKVLEAFGQESESQHPGDKSGDIAPLVIEDPARITAVNPTVAVV